jgi:hypothetical protein
MHSQVSMEVSDRDRRGNLAKVGEKVLAINWPESNESCPYTDRKSAKIRSNRFPVKLF